MIDPAARLKRALRALAKRDPVMAKAIDDVGFPEPRDREAGFANLLRIIVCQQVSNEAGAAIWRKLSGRLVDVTPEKVSRSRETSLCACGLSRPKVRYAKALAQAITREGLDMAALETAPDDEVRAKLTAVTGIGAWTADIYLMFALGRPDVMPGGDLALALAAERMLRLPARPTPVELEALAERWKPHRTAAAVMLWHYYRKAPLID
ncbi:MAG: DNA-3-methyladenine glycosylase 2 family protein [Rhodospirillaceae bacterium]